MSKFPAKDNVTGSLQNWNLQIGNDFFRHLEPKKGSRKTP
jgi:hypothetical protein